VRAAVALRIQAQAGSLAWTNLLICCRAAALNPLERISRAVGANPRKAPPLWRRSRFHILVQSPLIQRFGWSDPSQEQIACNRPGLGETNSDKGEDSNAATGAPSNSRAACRPGLKANAESPGCRGKLTESGAGSPS
jgi:hypothetical protein